MKRLGGWWNGLEGYLRRERYTLDLVTNFEVRARILLRRDGNERFLTMFLRSPCCGFNFGKNTRGFNCGTCHASMPAGFEPPLQAKVKFGESENLSFPEDLRHAMEALAGWRMDPVMAQLGVNALEESLGRALAGEWRALSAEGQDDEMACMPLEFTWAL